MRGTELTSDKTLQYFTIAFTLLQSEGVLLAAVGSQSVSERWASVQCLAVGGVASAPVVAELIAQLVSGHDHRRRERAAELLARLSSKTVSEAA